jgi:hypothetical protein
LDDEELELFELEDEVAGRDCEEVLPPQPVKSALTVTTRSEKSRAWTLVLRMKDYLQTSRFVRSPPTRNWIFPT